MTDLYDIEAALRTIAGQRRRADQLTLATTEIADKLANHLRAHARPCPRCAPSVPVPDSGTPDTSKEATDVV